MADDILKGQFQTSEGTVLYPETVSSSVLMESSLTPGETLDQFLASVAMKTDAKVVRVDLGDKAVADLDGIRTQGSYLVKIGQVSGCMLDVTVSNIGNEQIVTQTLVSPLTISNEGNLTVPSNYQGVLKTICFRAGSATAWNSWKSVLSSSEAQDYAEKETPYSVGYIQAETLDQAMTQLGSEPFDQSSVYVLHITDSTHSMRLVALVSCVYLNENGTRVCVLNNFNSEADNLVSEVWVAPLNQPFTKLDSFETKSSFSTQNNRVVNFVQYGSGDKEDLIGFNSTYGMSVTSYLEGSDGESPNFWYSTTGIVISQKVPTDWAVSFGGNNPLVVSAKISTDQVLNITLTVILANLEGTTLYQKVVGKQINGYDYIELYLNTKDKQVVGDIEQLTIRIKSEGNVEFRFKELCAISSTQHYGFIPSYKDFARAFSTPIVQDLGVVNGLSNIPASILVKGGLFKGKLVATPGYTSTIYVVSVAGNNYAYCLGMDSQEGVLKYAYVLGSTYRKSWTEIPTETEVGTIVTNTLDNIIKIQNYSEVFNTFNDLVTYLQTESVYQSAELKPYILNALVSSGNDKGRYNVILSSELTSGGEHLSSTFFAIGSEDKIIKGTRIDNADFKISYLTTNYGQVLATTESVKQFLLNAKSLDAVVNDVDDGSFGKGFSLSSLTSNGVVIYEHSTNCQNATILMQYNTNIAFKLSNDVGEIVTVPVGSGLLQIPMAFAYVTDQLYLTPVGTVDTSSKVSIFGFSILVGNAQGTAVPFPNFMPELVWQKKDIPQYTTAQASLNLIKSVKVNGSAFLMEGDYKGYCWFGLPKGSTNLKNYIELALSDSFTGEEFYIVVKGINNPYLKCAAYNSANLVSLSLPSVYLDGSMIFKAQSTANRFRLYGTLVNNHKVKVGIFENSPFCTDDFSSSNQIAPPVYYLNPDLQPLFKAEYVGDGKVHYSVEGQSEDLLDLVSESVQLFQYGFSDQQVFFIKITCYKEIDSEFKELVFYQCTDPSGTTYSWSTNQQMLNIFDVQGNLDLTGIQPVYLKIEMTIG